MSINWLKDTITPEKLKNEGIIPNLAALNGNLRTNTTDVKEKLESIEARLSSVQTSDRDLTNKTSNKISLVTKALEAQTTGIDSISTKVSELEQAVNGKIGGNAPPKVNIKPIQDAIAELKSASTRRAELNAESQ
jgi:hypothetical protein